MSLAEVIVGDRLAIGGKALFAPGDMSGATLVPYVALGSPRSLPSWAYAYGSEPPDGASEG